MDPAQSSMAPGFLHRLLARLAIMGAFRRKARGGAAQAIPGVDASNDPLSSAPSSAFTRLRPGGSVQNRVVG